MQCHAIVPQPEPGCSRPKPEDFVKQKKNSWHFRKNVLKNLISNLPSTIYEAACITPSWFWRAADEAAAPAVPIMQRAHSASTYWAPIAGLQQSVRAIRALSETFRAAIFAPIFA